MNTLRLNVFLIPLAASSLLFLSACGNKGPLVMPQKPVPVEEIAEPVADPATGTPTDAAPPASQDTDAGNPASVPDPVPLQDDKPARDHE